MAQQNINVGTAANDGTGDPLRTGFVKTQANFTDLYTTSPAFAVWTGSAWPARSSVTNLPGRTVIWIGNPGGTRPSDMATGDVWLEG